MRGFFLSFGIHAAGILGLVVLPSFSASELPPPRPPRDRVHDPIVKRVELRPAARLLPARGTARGGGMSTTRTPRSASQPAVFSDEPPNGEIEEPPGEPGLPPGLGSELGSELLPGPPQIPPTPRVVRAHVDVQAPRKLAGATPVYPPLARAARAEGTVVLECTIGADGQVRDVRVVRSHPLFDAAALEAVRGWSYTPTLLSGVPVSVLMTVTVEFKLSR